MTASGEVLVELETGVGQWSDITDDVRISAGIEITRGRTSESGQAPPASCALTLDNRAGRYSPRNPTSDLFGKIGRNTRMRVSIVEDATYDAFSQSNGTGDLSFTHTPAGTPTGVLVFLWEIATTTGATASVTYGGVPMERKLFAGFTLGSLNAVGSIYFLNTGIPAGAQTVAVDTTSTLTRHVSVQTVVGGDTCELDNRNFNYSNATPSANPGLNQQTFRRACLFGSLLSDLDDGSTISPRNSFTQSGETDIGTETVNTSRWPTSLNPSVYTFGWNAASAHWGIMTASVRAVHYRFWGEVAEFPPKFDLSTTEAWVPIEAAGITRRLGQGDAPSSTGLRAFLEPAAGLFRYWPLSGAVGTQYSLDIAPVWGQQTTGFRFYSEGSGSFRYGEPLQVSEAGSSNEDADYLGTGMALFHTNDAPMRADVANGYRQWAYDFVFQAPVFGSMQVFLNDYSGGGWTIYLFGSVPGLQVGFTDPATGPIGFLEVDDVTALTDGLPHHLRFQVEPTGVADSKFTLWIDGVQMSTGTQSGYRSTGLSLIRTYYQRADLETWVTLGHMAVFADSSSVVWPSIADTYAAAIGYDGEPAGERIERILALEDVDLITVGDMAATMPMGPQIKESMVKQIRDAEAADLGTLTEPRNATGLLYRAHATLYNQDPVLTLDFAGGQVAAPFEPVDDDQNTRNDITATRRGGDSFRIYKADGPLNIAPPPLGVGPYADEQTVNVADDGILPTIAGWLLHLGTRDAPRYPSLSVKLAAPDAAAVIADALAVDVGDRVDLANAAAVNIYDDAPLLVIGYNETIGPVEHDITFVCVPGDLYDVLELDDADARIDPGEGSTLSAGITSSATTMTVASDGFLWTTVGGQLPLQVMVGGEEMTVTAISGASSPQTFTVTRAVNGVSKAHSAGAIVRLKHSVVLAL